MDNTISLFQNLPPRVSDADTGSDEPESWMKDLVTRSQTDPGAPFSPEIITKLSTLKQKNRPAFERLIAQLKECGIRVPALEKEISRQKPVAADTTTCLDVRPFSVDGAELIKEIVTLLQRHLSLSPYNAEAVALWVIFAHAYATFRINPFLSILSPEKRCGKSTLLSIVQGLVPRPVTTSNITPAAIYRLIETCQPTLLLDEVDTFATKNEAIRGILNSAYKLDGSSIVRADCNAPAMLSTRAPIVMAGIGKLPDSLEDRSIIIEMRRKRKDEAVERFRSDRTEALEILRRKAARWVQDHLGPLSNWDGDAPECLNDRAADNWRPLLAIAHTAGGEWPQRAQEAAVELSRAGLDEESPGVMLLEDIKMKFGTSGAQRLTSKEILHHLNDQEHRPWPEFKRGRPLTACQLAHLLKPYGVYPSTIRPSNGGPTAKGYKLEDFEDAFARYVGDIAVTTPHPNRAQFEAIRHNLIGNGPVTDGVAPDSSDSAPCDDVTACQANDGQVDAARAPIKGQFVQNKISFSENLRVGN